MQKPKNAFIASLITLCILSAMTSGISVYQAKEKSAKVKIAFEQLPATNNKETVPTNIGPTAPVPTPVPAVTPNPTKSTTSTVSPKPVVMNPTPVPTPTPTPSPTYIYRDGTYPVTVSYSVPGTIASLNVTLTISKDTVIASSVSDPPTTDPTSKNWDNSFINNYQPYVIGKALSTLNLSNTSGASLTTSGFNNAVAKIRAAAH